MRVRMTAGLSGTRDGAPWPAVGGEITVPDAEGADLCSQGYAAPVAAVAVVEHAVAPPAPETRAPRRRKSA